jgi:hypothetical protein
MTDMAMADSGRAEMVVAEMQKTFVEMHNAGKGVIPDVALIDMILQTAQNYGAGFDGNVTSADDDFMNGYIMKTQDARLRRVENTMIVVAERLNQAINFIPGDTLGNIEARALASNNEVAVRTTRIIADQIRQALDKGLTYNPDFPTKNVKYEVAVPNPAIFNGFVGSYKVPSRIHRKYYGRLVLAGAKNSNESEYNQILKQFELRLQNIEREIVALKTK